MLRLMVLQKDYISIFKFQQMITNRLIQNDNSMIHFVTPLEYKDA
ncbi:hypothetical protein HMPREF0645_0550 [Hallella bergensis DSM 17361]|uniref:Uncharacterized protein n=1 Tax=Hallella bergensis DSM 17361 TaxID=585502 RepID=D1PUB5_9BACT|nr:hypothetical protein HMPREF0645_0550 [Hallella bergensis DSM 17361]